MAFCTLHFFSEALNREVSVNAFVPQNREGYKTLYLLHGLSDDQTVWQRYTEVELDAAQAGIAVIMPNGDRSFYTDLSSGDRYFTYISKELPEMMTRFFRGISPAREDNYIAGLSMGGYGAMKIAMRNPDCFAAVASMSGVMDIARFMREDMNSIERKSIFGNITNIKPEDDLFALAENLVQQGNPLRIYQACGTEDFLYGDNVKFRDFAQKAGLDLTYEEGSGIHNWSFWNEYIEKIMKWISEMQPCG